MMSICAASLRRGPSIPNRRPEPPLCQIHMSKPKTENARVLASVFSSESLYVPSYLNSARAYLTYLCNIVERVHGSYIPENRKDTRCEDHMISL